MSSSNRGHGGDFSVDGAAVEIDLAEWGWDAAARGEGSGSGSDPAPEDDGTVRLQKALAHAGVASRRACESLITGGRVTVNGRVQRELGSRIDPAVDDVRVDGVVVQLDVSKRYFVLNKPRGVVSTMSDENGRPDLREFTDQVDDRLYNVGRLDTDTSGLLILTNDGELAHKLAHPSFGVMKTYIAKVRGRVTAQTIQRLKDGVELADGPIAADRAKLLPGGSGAKHSLVEVTLHSGRNRIVRRMLAEVGHPVEELVRRQFGPLHLGTLRTGELRELSAAERGALLSAAEDGGDGSGSGSGSGARGGRSRGGRSEAKKKSNGRGASGRGASERGASGRGSDGRGGAGAGSGSGSSRGAQDRGARGSGASGSRSMSGGPSGAKYGAKATGKTGTGATGGGKSGAKRRAGDGGVTAGRPGDGKGARGMRGVAARGNPHGRGGKKDGR